MQQVSPHQKTYRSTKCSNVRYACFNTSSTERLQDKHIKQDNLAAGIVDEEEDVLSSSSSSQEGNEVLGEGYDDPNDLNNELVAEDDDSDEDEDLNRGETVTIEQKLQSKGLAADGTVDSQGKSIKLKYQLMTTSTQGGTSNQNNNDIYVNMGNVDLKLPAKKENSSND